MEIKHVKILTTKWGIVSVPALVDGGLAITPYHDWGGWRKHQFNVTHINTGCSVSDVQGVSKADAIEILAKYKNVKWRGIPIENLPACEVVTSWDIIQDEIGYGVRGEDTPNIISKAYGCE